MNIKQQKLISDFENVEFEDSAKFKEVSIIEIQKGTILYSGNADKHKGELPKDAFNYIGQSSKKEGTIVFFASEELAAKGYSRCFSAGRSWLNKFVVTKKLQLYDLNYKINKNYLEVDEAGLACTWFLDNSSDNDKIDGIYINYNGSFELALCNPTLKLKHIASKKCIGNRKFSKWLNID